MLAFKALQKKLKASRRRWMTGGSTDFRGIGLVFLYQEGCSYDKPLLRYMINAGDQEFEELYKQYLGIG